MTEQDFNELTREDAEGPSGPSPPKGPRAFRNISRELTEQDLANVAVQKLLLSEVDRLGRENEEYRLYMERFHEANRKVAVLEAVLEEKGKTKLAFEILSGTCLTFGGLAIGQMNALWPSPWTWIVGILGAVLLGGGIYAKKVKAS